MGNCADCKFFAEAPADYQPVDGDVHKWGACDMFSKVGMAYCDAEDHDSIAKVMKDAKAMALSVAIRPTAGAVAVRNDFSCSEFEAGTNTERMVA